jgi:hypothetical protein
MALFAAGQAPDEGPVARVVLRHTGFLFDHLRAVQPQPGFAGDNQVTAHAGGNRHAAKAAHRAGDDADHRLITAEVGNGSMDFGNGCQAQVGFLQAHAAGFKQDDGAGGNALAVVCGRQLQCAGQLGPAHFAQAAALKTAFDGGNHRWLAIQQALADDHAVIGLRHNALRTEPG